MHSLPEKLLTIFLFLFIFSPVTLAQDRDQTISDLSIQLQKEYGTVCKVDDCRKWVEILDELSAKPHHDMHPNGQTIGGKAGSTHNSALSAHERAGQLLPKLQNRKVRKEVRKLLESIGKK